MITLSYKKAVNERFCTLEAYNYTGICYKTLFNIVRVLKKESISFDLTPTHIIILTQAFDYAVKKINQAIENDQNDSLSLYNICEFEGIKTINFISVRSL